jgi:translation initiation factor IF-2
VLNKTRPLSRSRVMSALPETHHMSDNNQTGAPTAATGANASEPAAFGSFGATRGSGLARGKRPAPPAPASATPAAPSGYKPSSLEVITPKSEYVNPFTGETTVSAPAVNEPAPQAAQSVPSVASVPSINQTTPTAPAPAAPAAELFPLDDKPAASSAPAEKAELNILPTVEPKRPAVSWEAGSSDAAPSPRRDDRATFRTERNRREGGDGRENRDGREAKPFEPRDPRRDERKFEPRANQPYQPRDPRDERSERAPRAESPAPEKKSGGFFGWLKGLFGGGKSAETPTTGGGEHRHDRDGEHGGRRRHRGGRGRGRGGFDGQNRGGGQPFQHRDPRDEPQGESRGGGEHQHGEHRGDGQFGGGRRRRRGGRGRFRGDGGGDRGPRSEGQAGGGAI